MAAWRESAKTLKATKVVPINPQVWRMTLLEHCLVLLLLVSVNATVALPQSVTTQPSKTGRGTQHGSKAKPQTKTPSTVKTVPAGKAQPAAKDQPGGNDQPAAKDHTQPKDETQPKDQAAASTQPIQIKGVHIFQASRTPEGEGTYYKAPTTWR